jgi:hypothetical protein
MITEVTNVPTVAFDMMGMKVTSVVYVFAQNHQKCFFL